MTHKNPVTSLKYSQLNYILKMSSIAPRLMIKIIWCSECQNFQLKEIHFDTWNNDFSTYGLSIMTVTARAINCHCWELILLENLLSGASWSWPLFRAQNIFKKDFFFQIKLKKKKKKFDNKNSEHFLCRTAGKIHSTSLMWWKFRVRFCFKEKRTQLGINKIVWFLKLDIVCTEMSWK